MFHINRIESCVLDLSGTGQQLVVGFCDKGNEASGYINAGNLLSTHGNFSFSNWTSLYGTR